MSYESGFGAEFFVNEEVFNVFSHGFIVVTLRVGTFAVIS